MNLSSPSLAPGGIYLLLGGARSGKSSRAEALATEAAAGGALPVIYIATCATSLALDAEMIARLEAHRSHRPASWKTVEDRFDLDAVFFEHAGHVILLDCLTLWLSWQSGPDWKEGQILAALERALDAAVTHGIRLYMVSNELGMGLVPLGEGNRAYRDLVGRANQLVARRASVVEFIVAGLPLRLK